MQQQGHPKHRPDDKKGCVMLRFRFHAKKCWCLLRQGFRSQQSLRPSRTSTATLTASSILKRKPDRLAKERYQIRLTSWAAFEWMEKAETQAQLTLFGQRVAIFPEGCLLLDHKCVGCQSKRAAFRSSTRARLVATKGPRQPRRWQSLLDKHGKGTNHEF